MEQTCVTFFHLKSLSPSTDISGSPVSVDVGMCRSHCGGPARPSHDAGQREISKHASMLEFMRSKKVGGVSSLGHKGALYL